jgi:probable F420-dependent oxidoreductase
MHVDANIGGSSDGTGGGDLAALIGQIAAAERCGFDGLWSAEVSRDPFLPLMLVANESAGLQLGTAVAVAFARNPMTVASAAYDLNAFSAGRFVLGLGSQVQAHITRRFGMPWSAPAERMREFVQALQAIWRSWQTGETLDFRGQYYQHTLMTPMFRPIRSPWGPPPVMIAAVGPRMTEVAARSCDGLLIHSFTTERYLRDVTLPTVEASLAHSGRRRADFTMSFPGLVATAEDERGCEAAVNKVRHQIAFYGATPAYRGVLDLHGWGDLHGELHRLSRLGDWDAMTGLVDDEVLRTVAVVGEPKQVGAEIARRYAGLVDRFTLSTPYPIDDDSRAIVVAEIKAAASQRASD